MEDLKMNGGPVAAPPGSVPVLVFTVVVVSTTRGFVALQATVGPNQATLDAGAHAKAAQSPGFASPHGAARVELELLEKIQADADGKPRILKAGFMPKVVAQ